MGGKHCSSLPNTHLRFHTFSFHPNHPSYLASLLFSRHVEIRHKLHLSTYLASLPFFKLLEIRHKLHLPTYLTCFFVSSIFTPAVSAPRDRARHLVGRGQTKNKLKYVVKV
jgi:hypothetical protein